MVKFSSLKSIVLITILLLLLSAAAILYFIYFNDNNDSFNQNNQTSNREVTDSFGDPIIQVKAKSGLQSNAQLASLTGDWANQFNGYQLQPNTVFSYLDWAKTVDQRTSDKVHSVLASFIYEGAVRFGLEIGERHTQMQVPLTVNEGFEAQIESGRKDLTIRNPFIYTLKFEFVQENNSLVLNVSTNSSKSVKLPEISLEKKVIPFEKVLLQNKRAGGNVSLSTNGVNGLVVKVFKTNDDGKKSIVSRDYYPAQPQYVFKSSTPATPKDDLIIFE